MRARSTAAVLAALAACGGEPPVDAGPAAFWGEQRRGANSQNTSLDSAYWPAAAAAGIEFIRLAPDAWPAAERDFLLGDADDFDGIPLADLARLRRALDDAHRAGMPVVLTMFSLPGARWRQLNDETDDDRLWRDPRFQEQAAAFWTELAGALRDHPAIVAYNPLNEPHPERGFGFDDADDPALTAWRREGRGTAADLNAFNRRMVAAIRAADPDVPIVLDAGFYAAPAAVPLLEPVADSLVLYAFHFYEPWAYTTFRVNDGRFSYPEEMPGPGGPRPWTAERLGWRLDPVSEWAEAHGIPATHIIAGEFGVDRRVPGAERWLADVIAHLEARGWHWAFYAFRQDGAWGGMDYELGTAPYDAAYWGAVEGGADPERLKHRHDNPLWQVIRRALHHSEP